MWLPGVAKVSNRFIPPIIPPSGDEPTVTTAPTILGKARVGNVLWVGRGTYDWTFHVKRPRFRYAYRWKANGASISGAVNEFYVVQPADEGKAITVEETITDFYGPVTGVSAATAAVLPDDRATVTAESAGFKSFETTGTIAAGSNLLQVASVTGISVGDPIIVEVGTESGAGAPGTDGVGGSWPELAYATEAAMTSDSTQLSSKLAWVRATGRVWIHDGGGSWSLFSTTDPYRRIAYPAALKATVAAINPTTKVLTLKKRGAAGTPINAVAQATNAGVYFDNEPRMLVVGNGYTSSVLRDQKKLVFQGGGKKYAFGKPIIIEKSTDFFMAGAGVDETILYTPWGCPSMSTRFRGDPTRLLIDGFTVLGRNTDTTSIPDFAPGGLGTPQNLRSAAWIPEGVTYALFQNMKFINCWQAMSVNYGSDVWTNQCTALHVGQLIYIQWHFQTSDSTGGGYCNLWTEAGRHMATYETFRSAGVRFKDLYGKNIHISNNTSGNWDWERLMIDNDPQGAPMPYQSITGTPLCDVNSNIGNTSGGYGSTLLSQGGAFWDTTVIQRSPYGASGIAVGFIFGPANVNVHMIGTKHITLDYAGASSPVTLLADASDQSQSVVDSIANYAPNPSLSNNRADCFCFTSETGGRVIDSVADRIRAAVQSGNKTRAQFVADGGVLPVAA